MQRLGCSAVGCHMCLQVQASVCVIVAEPRMCQLSAHEMTQPHMLLLVAMSATKHRRHMCILSLSALPSLVQVRDKAAERELASLRKANKMDKQQRQQQLSEAWGDD